MENSTNPTIDQDKHRLARNSMWAIAGTFLSRLSGIVRTLVVNATFGANTTLDAFNAAFRFPNSLRDLFADGALSAAFVKVLVDLSPEGDAAIKRLVSITSGFFLSITLILAIFAAIFAKPFIHLIGGHEFNTRGGLNLAASLFQILAFYLPITMLNAIVMGVLGLRGDMFRAMNGSIFLSVGMIAGALLFPPLFHLLQWPEIYGLALGAMIGVILQLVYQIQPLIRWKLLALPVFNPIKWWRYNPLFEILRLMTPRALGQGALVIALMFNTFFAIQIGKGALTYVATTVIIIQVPIGLFGVATGFASLPLLTQAFNERHFKRLQFLLNQSLATTNWLGLSTLIGLSLLIVPFYTLIFQHGKITAHDTIQNSIAICAYGIGIFFASSGKILLNVLYAINATRQIVINSIVYLIVNVFLSALLAPRFGLVGLGVSFATATAVDCWLNYFVLNHRIKRQLNEAPFSLKYTSMFATAGVFSYFIGLIGVWLCKNFWPHFEIIAGFTWNTMSAMVSLLILFGIILLVFIPLCWRFGPQQLQQLLKKMYGWIR